MCTRDDTPTAPRTYEGRPGEGSRPPLLWWSPQGGRAHGPHPGWVVVRPDKGPAGAGGLSTRHPGSPEDRLPGDTQPGQPSAPAAAAAAPGSRPPSPQAPPLPPHPGSAASVNLFRVLGDPSSNKRVQSQDAMGNTASAGSPAGSRQRERGGQAHGARSACRGHGAGCGKPGRSAPPAPAQPRTPCTAAGAAAPARACPWPWRRRNCTRTACTGTGPPCLPRCAPETQRPAELAATHAVHLVPGHPGAPSSPRGHRAFPGGLRAGVLPAKRASGEPACHQRTLLCPGCPRPLSCPVPPPPSPPRARTPMACPAQPLPLFRPEFHPSQALLCFLRLLCT